jgi:hypothetical protein
VINEVFGIFSMCVLGKRLLKDISISDCNKNSSGPLYKIFCGNSTCDEYFLENDVFKVRGIKGLSSGVFLGEFNTCKAGGCEGVSRIFRTGAAIYTAVVVA